MEVEAEGLYGLWASVEYLRMPSSGDDGGRGREPGREAGAMIRATKFEVDNDRGEEVDISIDPESESIVYFIIEQNNQEIIASLDCLRGLIEAAEQLIARRKRRES